MDKEEIVNPSTHRSAPHHKCWSLSFGPGLRPELSRTVRPGLRVDPERRFTNRRIGWSVRLGSCKRLGAVERVKNGLPLTFRMVDVMSLVFFSS
jgi:hypothetical protein